jgi:hypothetical protein
MESMILFIENLRAFILNDSEQAQRYGTFLDSLGYGATGCSHSEGREDRITENDEMLFKRVAEVLEQFLKTEGRLAGGEGDKPDKH